MNFPTSFVKQCFLTTFLTSIFIFANAQGFNQDYFVQSNDWLSKIADKAYGNPHLYYHIIEGTNEKALVDKSYRKITNVERLAVGQKLWIPDYNESTSSSSGKADKTATDKKGDGILVTIPSTNCEIRIWYNYQVIAIAKLSEKWLADGLDLKTCAEKAYKLRHDARVNARFMMQDKTEVEQFQERDMKKYGNPDGPTFEYLMEKSRKKGLSEEECYKAIVESSGRVSKVYNSECE